MTHRIELDSLGEKKVLRDALYGIHTVRALENFPLSGRRVHPALIRGFGHVKKAAAQTNASLGYFTDDSVVEAILEACGEMIDGLLDEHILVDALQGGAGTSTNMNVNEVIANRALLILGERPGTYERVSPTAHINMHQSTNDTYPSALKTAAIFLLKELEAQVVCLQEAYQCKEQEFSGVVKVGRTQMQDAALITLGREMGAVAEALSRDRWRIYKCEERLRVVNLGGTAIGTGIGAPRRYIFKVVEALKESTGIGFARAENLVDATQNADVFVEVSGILKALAVTLMKASSDLRFMSSGPKAGIGEISLPALQVGSSIMPHKVNPVVPEAVTQVSMQIFGSDSIITMAAASGHLELNPFLPLIAKHLLSSIQLLSAACSILVKKCIPGISANLNQMAADVSTWTSTATALVEKHGYDTACELAKEAQMLNVSLKQVVISRQLMTPEEFDEMISPQAVCRLGAK